MLYYIKPSYFPVINLLFSCLLPVYISIHIENSKLLTTYPQKIKL